MKTKVMFSKKSDEWSTPQNFYDKLNSEFEFTLDPCATKENAKCKNYYTESEDGLSQNWIGETVFCNPPYSKIKDWAKKCYEEHIQNGVISVMLIPARTDTKYFHNWIYNKAELRFIKGRLKFGESKNSAPFPSVLVIFAGKKEVEE